MRRQLINSDTALHHGVYVTAVFVVKWAIMRHILTSAVVELTTLRRRSGTVKIGGGI
jgi:hypothetical protein